MTDGAYWICTSHPAKKDPARAKAEGYARWQDDPRYIVIASKQSEMAERIRRHDWAKTSLGRIEDWSDTLISSVALVLSSEFPMSVYWGDELIVIYNDAYAPIVGPRKHPDLIFGLPLRQGWYEVIASFLFFFPFKLCRSIVLFYGWGVARIDMGSDQEECVGCHARHRLFLQRRVDAL